MSITVGKGFQPDSGTTIFVTHGGDDNLDGTTDEKPVRTIGQGIARAVASGASNVDIGDGLYDEQVEASDAITLTGLGATLFNSTANTTALKAASSQVNRLGFAGSSGDNSTIYEVDGVVRSIFNVTTLVLGSNTPGSTGITGVSIKGSNDDIRVAIDNGELRADDSIGLDITGESTTAINVAIGTFTNFGDNNTGINCNSSNPAQVVNVDFENITGDPASAPAGGVFCRGTSGFVNLRGTTANTGPTTFVLVEDGLRVDISVAQVTGNIIAQSGGNLSFSKFGLMLGNLTLEAGSTTFGDIHTSTGAVTIEANATFNGIIGPVSGTITIDPAATVNGIINGKHYGSYVNYSDTVWANNEVSEGLGVANEVLQHDFVLPCSGEYKVEIIYACRQDNINGRVAADIMIDSVVQDNLHTTMGYRSNASADNRDPESNYDIIHFDEGTYDIDFSFTAPGGMGTAYVYYRRICVTLVKADQE